jgi:hypothetical protein
MIVYNIWIHKHKILYIIITQNITSLRVKSDDFTLVICYIFLVRNYGKKAGYMQRYFLALEYLLWPRDKKNKQTNKEYNTQMYVKWQVELKVKLS